MQTSWVHHIFFFNFGPISTGFSPDVRSWDKGDRKNTHVRKYAGGYHGNAKNRLSHYILPGKHGTTLAAFSSRSITTERASKRILLSMLESHDHCVTAQSKHKYSILMSDYHSIAKVPNSLVIHLNLCRISS